MRQNDVVVVGAGPAGAWAAQLLAKAGARVTVFDATHPREKACGGGLTGRALALVERTLGDRLAGVAVDSLRFETATSAVEMPLPASGCTGASALVVVDRRGFDAALLDAAVSAGAVHVPERVCDIRVNESGAEVMTASAIHRGSVVLGADGANSLVRRRVHAAFSRAQISIATGYFLHGVTSTEVRIRSVADPPGYIWSFPRTDHLAVGICAQADLAGVDRLRQVVRGWIEQSQLARGARLQPYSWPIPSLRSRDFTAERVAGQRWLLLGDAAGLVDPLTREGIYYALESAHLAAEALTSDRHPERTYADAVRRRIYPELSRAADLKARFFTSGFTELMVTGLQRSVAVRRVMADLVAGEQPYRTLKRRLVRTFEVKLAFELLRLQWAGRRLGAKG